MDDLDAELGVEEIHLDDIWHDELEGEAETAKQPSLPVKVQWDKETRFETGFHRSARVCLGRINDLLLQQRWQEAAEYMISYTEILEDTTTTNQLLACEIIWKLGTAILHQHPNAKPEDFNSFYERMKHTGVKGYLKICLEHSFHLLVNGKFDDAKRQLSVAESWRYGKVSASQPQMVKLVQAYRSFLDYFTWLKKKSSVSGDDDSDASAYQEMHIYFRQASVNLQEILKEPGVWDPFIISYVNMLEFYGDQEGALNVLKEYAYDNRFPSNPNAHVYLYQHLKKHDAPEKKLIQVLQILHALVPCHELMLEFCHILLQREKEEDLREALTVIFSLLDYSGWKDNLEAWCCLRDLLKLLKKKKLKRFIPEEWESRGPWWPAYHFRTYQAHQNFELNPELVKVKAVVAAALLGNRCIYCRTKNKLIAETRREKQRTAPLTRRTRGKP
ncbi:hypothetical protein SKAU_G00182490 [Synaphobranchus kaupii]|uniref:TATA box-binding protein-associated factor RNA polymerase I subunit A n=1 Tax=Synaphobranchus kaupii TaxID=118154 RepID=A0A9Q1FBV5_SYNKA|nr:hypothetical protein SKAU_G00182490 [Synaphobranchus kaupii]